MSYICGSCHQEHKVPKREDDEQEKISTGSAGLACVLALVRERDSLNLQVNAMRPVVEAAVDLARALSEKRGEEGGIVVLLNKVKQYTEKRKCDCGKAFSLNGACANCGGVI